MKCDFEKAVKDGVDQAMRECELKIGMTLREAVEKQIPKKLICIEIEKCCPVCKEGICLIGDDGNYGNYCYKCGQALDWGTDE